MTDYFRSQYFNIVWTFYASVDFNSYELVYIHDTVNGHNEYTATYLSNNTLVQVQNNDNHKCLYTFKLYISIEIYETKISKLKSK